MSAKRLMLTAIAFGLLGLLIMALPAQAQEFRGFTCEGLWEHVHSGGYVIFDETNRWFYSTCTGKAKADDNEEAVEEPERRPTVVTCAYLPPRVAVFGHVRGTQCQMVNAAGVGRMDLIKRGVIDAVDVWSYVNGGLEVCFRNVGSLVFLDAAYIPRMMMELATFQRDGMTCGAIDRAGTVVLLREASPSAATQAGETPAILPVVDAIPQADCQIKLQETLFLRDGPGGQIIGLVWLYSEVPVFEVSGDWYKVEFEGETGYISRDYHRVLRGACA